MEIEKEEKNEVEFSEREKKEEENGDGVRG